MRPHLPLPTHDEIVALLKKHPLIRLREDVTRAFLVGSFAGGGSGQPHEASDVDVLLEVPRREDMTPHQLEEHYRAVLRSHLHKHDIRDSADRVHPQWAGRRVDVYFTYAADTEKRPKRLLPRKPEFMSARELREPEDFAAEDVLNLAMNCVGTGTTHIRARRKLERLAAKRRAGTLRLYGQAPLLEVLSTKSMILLAAEVASHLQGRGVAPGITRAVDNLGTVVSLPEDERAPVFCRCLLDVVRAIVPKGARDNQDLELAMSSPAGCQFVAELLAYSESSGACYEYLLTDLERGLFMPGGERALSPEPQALFTQARMRLKIRQAGESQAAPVASEAPGRRRAAV